MVVAVVGLASACGGARVPPESGARAVVVDAGVLAPAPPRDTDAGALLPPEPDGLRVPEQPRTEGCVFASDRADASFVPAPDERAILGARGARVTIHLGSAASWVELETRDVRAAGVMPPNFVELHPRASFLFDPGSEVTGRTAFFTPRPAGPTDVRVSLRFGDAQDRERVVACDALALAPVAGAEATRLAPDPGLPSAVVLASFAKPTPVSDTESGPVVSRLEHRRAVRVLARAKGRVKVGWSQGGTVEVGWVDAAHVAPAGTPLTEPGARVVTLDEHQARLVSDGDALRPAPRPWPRTVCREEVRLVAEHAHGTRWVIGVVKPGTPLALLHRWGALWEIAADVLDLDLEDATMLYVPARDVARACAERASP